MAADLGEMYRAARMRISAFVSDEIGAVPVPAAPLWDVHDVVAHLAGVTEDVHTGNMEGVTTDPWTAAQVERGRTKTVADLVAMWDEYAPRVEWFLSTPDGASAYRAVLDVHTHEADLLNALGRPIDLPAGFLTWMTPLLRDSFDEAVAQAGLPAPTVNASNLQWFRGRLGRRTADEVRAYGWSADPDAYLDHWFIFGRAERSLGETCSDGPA
ncbi:MAG: maleylpyruvate isomerase N-terminal domain-containing protein [Actinomycetota bacterium]